MSRTVSSKVFALWDTLEEMADDLNTSVNLLRLQRERGEVPEARHDNKIVRAARLLGKRLSGEDLARVRAARPLHDLNERKQTIRQFIGEAGGYDQVAMRCGMTRQGLYASKYRGFLPRAHKYEFMRCAEEVGFVLPDEIFSRPVG